MRRLPLVLALAAVVAVLHDLLRHRPADGVPVTPLPSGSIPPSDTTQPSLPASPSVTVTPSPELPAGVPTSYDQDVREAGRPLEGAHPAGDRGQQPMDDARPLPARSSSWRTSCRPAIPSVQARGLVEWRRTEGASRRGRRCSGSHTAGARGSWASKGSSATRPETARSTCCCSEATGGSGACGNWRVIDLAAAAERWTKATLRCAGRSPRRPRRHRAHRGRLRSRRSPLLSERVPNDRPGLRGWPRIREGQRAVHARLSRAGEPLV